MMIQIEENEHAAMVTKLALLERPLAFAYAGGLTDLILALPVIRALGGGEIAAADVVVCNQSPIYAIAEAMKKPIVLEVCPQCPPPRDRADVYTGDRAARYIHEAQATHMVQGVTAAPKIRGTGAAV